MTAMETVPSQNYPPGHDIVPVLHNPSNEWASNLCFTETIEDINFNDNSSAHEFLTI